MPVPGQFDDATEDHEEFLFSPQLYIQRYVKVIEIILNEIENLKLNSLMDIGCANCKFLKYVKNHENLIQLVGVDIDKSALESATKHLNPLPGDYIQKRSKPLNIKLLHGGLEHLDEISFNVDVITAIEVIEHLEQTVLSVFPKNIFSFKPKMVIVSTPNQEFNCLFRHFEGPFRHWDHKFEWTRNEFEDWATQICSTYPDYKVEFTGVGKLNEEDFLKFGYCSQIAVFTRFSGDTSPGNQNSIENKNYECIFDTDFPFCIDTRSDFEKLKDEVKYCINLYSYHDDNDDNEYDDDVIKVKVNDLLEFPSIKKLTNNINYLLKALEGEEPYIENNTWYLSVKKAIFEDEISENEFDIQEETLPCQPYTVEHGTWENDEVWE